MVAGFTQFVLVFHYPMENCSTCMLLIKSYNVKKQNWKKRVLIYLETTTCYQLKLHFADDPSVLGRLSFLEDPLGTQRLSFISADGSEIDSDYSSASSVAHLSEEQKTLEYVFFSLWNLIFNPLTPLCDKDSFFLTIFLLLFKFVFKERVGGSLWFNYVLH